MTQTDRKLGRPAGSNRQDTIARALDSARRLFTERGYGGTTLKDISRDMGVTHATLYLYFDSKVDLYCQTIEATQALLRPAFEAVLSKDLPCKQKLVDLLQVALEDIADTSGGSPFLAGVPLELTRHAELREAIDYQQNGMALTLLALFNDGLDSGEIIADASAEDLMVLFMGSLLGMNLFHRGGQIGSMDTAFALFTTMFDQGVFADA
ncbi:MAG: TetR/AcrR family transcriptional regulator [Pseudomonadota bacterium]